MEPLDEHCTSSWFPGTMNCKIRDLANCSHPEWPTSCPVVRERKQQGCRVYSCPTRTPEEFYGPSGWTSSTDPIGEVTTERATTEPVGGYTWVGPVLAVCGILSIVISVATCIWKCCLTAGFRQRVRTRVATLRDGAIALLLAFCRMVRALWQNTVGRLHVPRLYRGQGQFPAPPPQVVVQGPAQGQGVGPVGVGGPQQQPGAPQGQGGAQGRVLRPLPQRRRAPQPPQVGVLGQVQAHLQAGPGPNPVPVNAGPAAPIPPPPNNQVPNLLLRQPNLPQLPAGAQQVQRWQDQGLVPAPANPPPPQDGLVAPQAPAPAQAQAPQAGNSTSTTETFHSSPSNAELGLEPIIIDNESNNSLADYEEQFSFFSPRALEALNRSSYFSFFGAADLSDSDEV